MRKILYIFGQFNDEDIEWIARVGVARRFAKGMRLIEEGTHLDTVHILLEGAMSVSIAKLGEIAKLGNGEIIGEMSLIDSRPTTASVMVEEDSLVLAVSHAAIRQRIETDTAFSARFHRAVAMFLADRMRSTIQHMGYGAAEKGNLQEDIEAEGELDTHLLDTVYLAGLRFERLLGLVK